MKKLIVFLIFINMPFLRSHANSENFQGKSESTYSLYLVRHAEKQKEQDDPALTQCGKFRAQQLASILEKADIQTIYSTRYKRTMATAYPLAQQKKLAIKNYAPNKLDQLAWQLTKLKENALIVGHSNTTTQLTALLSQTQVEAITEKQYRGLYQVVISGESRQLILLMQPLICR